MQHSRYVAVYVRISDDPSQRAEGVDRQERDCLEQAKRIYPTHEARVFLDNDLSASKYSKKPRPAFESMLEAIEHGEVVAVVAWHQDRMFRKPTDLERFIALCERKHLLAIHANGDHDLTSADGQLMARITGAVSAKSSDDTSRRVKRAVRDRLEKGEWPGGTGPYGYDAEPRTLRINHEQAADIRDAARFIIEGGSLRDVVRLPFAPDGRPQSCNGWRLLLKSPTLAGRTSLGNRANWEPILDQSTHAQLVAILTDPSRKTYTSKERTHWLSGLLVCSLCRTQMGPMRGKYMRCIKCMKLSISEAFAEAEVSAALFRAVAEVRDEAIADDGDEAEVDNSAMLRELAEDYAKRRITRDEWDAMRAILVPKPKPAPRPLRPSASLADLWPSMSPRERYNAATAVIEAVWVTPCDQSLPVPKRSIGRLHFDWRA